MTAMTAITDDQRRCLEMLAANFGSPVEIREAISVLLAERDVLAAKLDAVRRLYENVVGLDLDTSLLVLHMAEEGRRSGVIAPDGTVIDDAEGSSSNGK